MEKTNEQVLYTNGPDRITPTTAVIGGRSFDLSDIDTVSLVPPVLKREYGMILFVVGFVILVLGYIVWGIFLTPMLAGTVFIIVGLAIYFAVRNAHTLRLNAKNGQVTALQFPSGRQANQILAALSQALSAKHA